MTSLLEGDGVRAGVRVLLGLEVIKRHAKLAQHGVAVGQAPHATVRARSRVRVQVQERVRGQRRCVARDGWGEDREAGLGGRVKAAWWEGEEADAEGLEEGRGAWVPTRGP